MIYALEAKAAGQSATAGALAGIVGEAAAPAISQILYGTSDPEKLTDSQKQNIIALSQISANLTGALVGNSTQAAAVSGEIGKRAVENNFAIPNPNTITSEMVSGWLSRAKAREIIEPIEKESARQVLEESSDRLLPHYVVGEIGFYKRTGDLFAGIGMSPISILSGGLNGSLQVGWISNLDKRELGGSLGKTINSTLMVNSIGGSLCYNIYCAEYSQTIGSSSSKYLYNIGFGKGGSSTSFGADQVWKLTNDK